MLRYKEPIILTIIRLIIVKSKIENEVHQCKNTVLKNLIWQKKIYDAFGGDLIWLEDRTQRRYTRKNYYTPLNFEINVNVRDMFR